MARFPRSALLPALCALSLGGVACGQTTTAAPNTTAVSNPADGRAALSAPGPLRLSGTVEAVRSRTVAVPRLAGAALPSLVITKMVKSGTRVEAGDVVVQFDPQLQQQASLDRAADVVDLDGQIKRRLSEQAAARERDNTELKQAEHDVERARLDTRRNEFVGTTEAEKYTLALEQAQARLDQLRKTYDLKRTAAAADIRILEIRRERAERNMLQAQRNAELMEIRAPFGGLIVTRTTFRGSAGFVEVQEGDDVRPGLPIVSIVDTSSMQVRARVNQSDIGWLRPGLPAKIRLDGFPELLFDGLVDLITPLAVSSEMSTTVRVFSAVISIKGTHDQLLPDLTASVEILPPSAVAANWSTSGGR
jgi:multidrug resistance efflux pump